MDKIYCSFMESATTYCFSCRNSYMAWLRVPRIGCPQILALLGFLIWTRSSLIIAKLKRCLKRASLSVNEQMRKEDEWSFCENHDRTRPPTGQIHVWAGDGEG